MFEVEDTVSTKVMSSFNHNADLLRFTTEGLVTLLAMHHCGLRRHDEKPPEFPDDVAGRDEYLLALSRKVVDTVWRQVSDLDVAAVLNADDEDDDADENYYEYCFCKTGKSILSINARIERPKLISLNYMGFFTVF